MSSSNPRPHENTNTDENEPIIPTPGSFEPRPVNVRLVCAPDVMDAALASLTDFYGEAWKPSNREPARSSDGRLMLTGTLIVPAPRKDPTE